MTEKKYTATVKRIARRPSRKAKGWHVVSMDIWIPEEPTRESFIALAKALDAIGINSHRVAIVGGEHWGMEVESVDGGAEQKAAKA